MPKNHWSTNIWCYTAPKEVPYDYEPKEKKLCSIAQFLRLYTYDSQHQYLNQRAIMQPSLKHGTWGVSQQKSIVPNQDGWDQYSYSNFTSLTVAHFAYSYPMKKVLLIWEFHRDAASNNPTLKSMSAEKHLQPLMFLFYCTSNGMALRRCKAWCTVGLWKTVWGKDDVI